MITSIRLLNWRSHADTKLEFSRGTNLLVGIMGAGKSSVLEALSFALFGTFPALKAKKLGLEDIPRLSEGGAHVELGLEWQGASYRLERTITRKRDGSASSDAKAFREGKLVESGQKAVASFAERLLSVDYDLFTRAIYSEQNNMDHFLNLDPRKRKEEMDALLGLDRFEQARQNAVSVVNMLRAERKGLESAFSQERHAAAEKGLAELSGAVAKAAAEEAGAKANLASQEKAMQAAEAGLRALSAKRERHEQLAREVLRAESAAESLAKEIGGRVADAESCERAKAGLRALQAGASAHSAKARETDALLQALSREAGYAEARLKTIDAEAKRSEEARAELAKLLAGRPADAPAGLRSSIENELIALQSGQQALRTEEQEVRDGLGRLKPGMSKCPLCGCTLGSDAVPHILREKQARLDAIAVRSGELMALLSGKQAALKRASEDADRARALSERAKAADTLVSERPELLSKREGLAGRQAALSAQKSALQKEADALQEEVRKASLLAGEMDRLLRIGKELAEHAKRRDSAQAELKALGYDARAYEEARSAAEGLRRTHGELSQSLRFLGERLKEWHARGESLRGELKQVAETRSRAARLASQEEELMIYKNALLETQMGLRAGLTDAINGAMNEIWPVFYPYRNYTQLRLQVTERDYLFEVYDGGGWKPLESVASGGERACAALTLRVALSVVLAPNLSWLILDEPTHSLDRKAVEMLSEMLQAELPKVIAQTFVITHDEGLMGSEFARSYRLTRDKESNGATKAEAI